MIIHIVVCLTLFASGSADFKIVKDTTNGKVLGTVRVLYGIEEYLGIPFASPPTDDLRWKPPIPYPPWKDSGEVWNATYKRSICSQYDVANSKVVGAEDCLFLNIYVPRTPSFELYPVIVYLHPGSFISDSGNFYDGSLLTRQGDVIVITINYRLGALGFLNTGDNQVKGNFGLLDQKAAIEWVHNNAYNFQGDPDRVTIYGAAAGAVSALLHAISPQNQNGVKLFQRVIAQSGSPFCWWGFQSDPRYYAMKMIQYADCPDYSTALGIQCLRGKYASEIVQLQSLDYGISEFYWVPTVDGTYITDIPDSMVSDTNLSTILNSRYEYLIGTTNFESAWDYYMIKNIHDRDDFVNYLQWELRENFADNDKIAEVVAINYIDSANPPTTDLEWQHLSFNVSRDFMFLAPAVNMTYLATGVNGFNSTAYFYLFSHKPSQAMVAAGLAYPSADIVNGATHKDDIAYAFGAPLTLPNVTDADRQISVQMMTYWANFAKTGNPSLGKNVDTIWPQYDWASQTYLQFGNKNEADNNFTLVKDHLQSNEVVFWSRELGLLDEGKGLDDSVAQPATNDTASNSTATFDPVVTTKLGNVRGLRIVEDGYLLDRFLRIPFAKPPVGFLRFQRPEPHPGWEGVLDTSGNRSAVEWLNGCPLFNFIRNGSFGKEDCLFLNIYVPGGIDAVRDQPLPVMVWLFGGAFVWGRGTGLRFYYDMKHLSTQGQVIGVTINYRLGPLGFLSTMDEYAPGNAGLLDQVQALRWVRENIAAFGGDPDRVTIFGESAGAGSVTMHMVSPLSKDLFLRGIAESGSIPAAWSFSYEPLKPVHRLAQSLDCPIDSNKLLVKCLQNKPVDKIVKAGLYNDFGQPKNNAWAAVVDGYFLMDDPRNLALESIDKDLLIGHNSMDGFMFSMVDFPAVTIDVLPMSREDIINASSMFAPNVPGPVAEAVAFEYIDWEESDTGSVWPKIAIVNMYTDHMFVVPTYWNVNKRVSANGTGHTYLYRFSQKARLSRLFPEWKEADHTTEMVYTFGHPFEGRNFDDADRKLSLAIMSHWTNFAWSGNPNLPNEGDVFTEWPEYKLETKYAVEFNTSTASNPERYPPLISNYRGDIVEYWTGHLRDIWNLPLENCQTTSAPYQSRDWINYPTEIPGTGICPGEPLVRVTEAGCIRGYELQSNNATIERYLGIPYVKPPIGELRFQPPKVADPWTDVYPASNSSKICPQGSILDDTMSEDCLYLNIYVPKINATNEAGLPVMVWLHGGDFINGNGMEKLQGDTLAALGGVIVINFNYRLGSFGFMTTDDEFSPGNYGLLDQQFALKWVKNNIANFGGNPDDITIFGNSAGGQSVLLQSLSPTNKGLGISKAIMESASIIPHDDLRQLDRAISLAMKAGCTTTSGNQAMVKCLRDLDAADLLSAQAQTGLKFEPTVDGEFLPNHPRELADQTEVRKWKYIIGANNGDGSVRWGDVQTVTNEENFHKVVDKWFQEPYGWRESIPDQHYADYDDLNFFSNETKMQIHLTEMFGDERYIAPGLEVAEDYTNYGADVYFYFFTYPYDRPDFYGFPAWAGAAHSAEFSFVWGDVINDDMQSNDVKNLSRRIIDYWSNFAKTGNPNNGYPEDMTSALEWPTYKGPRPSTGLGSKIYIQLDVGDKTALKNDLRPTEKTLWVDYMVSQAKYCEVEKPTTKPTSPPPVEDLDNPVVETTSGRLSGVRIQNDLVDVQAFFGVRYAKPPTGKLRFAKAEPVENWQQNPWDGDVRRPPCMQWSNSGNIIGSEDCLYMDIHMPTGLLATNSASMPILFWIHGDFVDVSSHLGGSFWSGGGSVEWDPTISTIDPSYLADMGGVVVVSPSFRLGPFGFMTTENDAFEGNYGLSDLKEALLWIHRNAQIFAADPSKITVIGQGSGAAAAELLSILPSTKDYVRRVISMSGSSSAPWAFCLISECADIVHQAANANGCSGTDAEIKNCLQSKTAEEILSSTPFKPVVPNSNEISNAWGMWRFVKDGKLIPKNDTMEDLFPKSNCDFINGVLNNEFFNYIKAAYPDAGSTVGFLQQSIEDTNRFLSYSNVEVWSNETYKALAHEYTNWDARYNSELQFQSSVEYYNDIMFAVQSSNSMASKSSGFGSQFQYVINRLLMRNDNVDILSWTGGRHGDDVLYTFGMPFQDHSFYSDEDRQFSQSIMSYWSNFAWFGDPNNDLSAQTWPQYSTRDRFYLQMDTGIDLPGFPSDYNLEKNSLWSDVMPDFSPEAVDDCVAAEVPPIGTGIGLYLTPEEADTAIYVMFGVCLGLGTVIILLPLHWYCSSAVIKSKNKKRALKNHYQTNGTMSGWDAYNNVAFEDEKPKEGQISAL